MTTYDRDPESSIELDDRDVRALTEHLTIVPVPGADGLCEAVSESGASYLIDERARACECADYRHRTPDGGCKHIRRWAFATGRRELPDWIDESAISRPFGEFVDRVDDDGIDTDTDTSGYRGRGDSTVEHRSADDAVIVSDGGREAGDEAGEECACADAVEIEGVDPLPCFECFCADRRAGGDA